MITKKQKEIFTHTCFIAMMNGGVIDKSPEYIAEKMEKKDSLTAMWNSLHSNSKNCMKEWAKLWNFPLKELLEEIGFDYDIL